MSVQQLAASMCNIVNFAQNISRLLTYAGFHAGSTKIPDQVVLMTRHFFWFHAGHTTWQGPSAVNPSLKPRPVLVDGTFACPTTPPTKNCTSRALNVTFLSMAAKLDPRLAVLVYRAISISQLSARLSLSRSASHASGPPQQKEPPNITWTTAPRVTPSLS